jgi:hypothetical protein
VTRDLPFTAAGARFVAVAHPVEHLARFAWRCVAVHALPSRRLVGVGVWARTPRAWRFDAVGPLPRAVAAVLPGVLGELGDA